MGLKVLMLILSPSNWNSIEAVLVNLCDFSKHYQGTFQLFSHMTWCFYGSHVFKGCFIEIWCFLEFWFNSRKILDFIKILFQDLYISFTFICFFWFYSNQFPVAQFWHFWKLGSKLTSILRYDVIKAWYVFMIDEWFSLT